MPNTHQNSTKKDQKCVASINLCNPLLNHTPVPEKRKPSPLFLQVKEEWQLVSAPNLNRNLIEFERKKVILQPSILEKDKGA